jgi:NTP pyrophosphatase (non-canonical NTP hydrolase)
MTLTEYQKKAMATCMSSCDNMAYMLTNLVAEVGELSGKIAKAIRKEKVVFRRNNLDPVAMVNHDQHEEWRNLISEIVLEAGDVLWQLTGVLTVLGVPLEAAAQMNIDKLADRAQRGKIDGDGDHR